MPVGEDGRMDDARDRLPRPWVAVRRDVVVLVVFVLVGRRSHQEDAGFVGFLRVWWPFAVGLAVAWLSPDCARAPLAWRRAIVAWLVTVGAGMALRIAVQGRDSEGRVHHRDPGLRGRRDARLARRRPRAPLPHPIGRG